MGNVVTLAQLKQRSLDRADADLGFINEDRLVDYINAEAAELYDILMESHEDYFFKTTQFTLTSATEQYSLPSDFYKDLKVYRLKGGDRFPLERFNMEEIDYGQHNIYDAPAYRIMGDKILFTPQSSRSGTVEMFYVPQYQLLSNDIDSISFGIPSLPVGWEEIIVVGAAIKILTKEESDTTPLQSEKARLVLRLTQKAENRDTGRPNRVVDVRRFVRRDIWS